MHVNTTKTACLAITTTSCLPRRPFFVALLCCKLLLGCSQALSAIMPDHSTTPSVPRGTAATLPFIASHVRMSRTHKEALDDERAHLMLLCLITYRSPCPLEAPLTWGDATNMFEVVQCWYRLWHSSPPSAQSQGSTDWPTHTHTHNPYGNCSIAAIIPGSAQQTQDVSQPVQSCVSRILISKPSHEDQVGQVTWLGASSTLKIKAKPANHRKTQPQLHERWVFAYIVMHGSIDCQQPSDNTNSTRQSTTGQHTTALTCHTRCPIPQGWQLDPAGQRRLPSIAALVH
jgi:hypothetical protein